MISLSYLNKLLKLSFFIFLLAHSITYSYAAVDIWEEKENDNDNEEVINNSSKEKIKSPILSDSNKIIEIGYINARPQK